MLYEFDRNLKKLYLENFEKIKKHYSTYSTVMFEVGTKNTNYHLFWYIKL